MTRNGWSGMARIGLLTNTIIYKRWDYVWLPYAAIGYIIGFMTNSGISFLVFTPITLLGAVLIFFIYRRHERFISNLHWF
jgi:hypothetical protein